MSQLPDRVLVDKLPTPDGHVYRIHAWRDEKFIRATVVPHDLAIGELIKLGFSAETATDMVDTAKTPAARRGKESQNPAAADW